MKQKGYVKQPINVAITGKIGTGKTTVIAKLLDFIENNIKYENHYIIIISEKKNNTLFMKSIQFLKTSIVSKSMTGFSE